MRTRSPCLVVLQTICVSSTDYTGCDVESSRSLPLSGMQKQDRGFSAGVEVRTQHCVGWEECNQDKRDGRIEANPNPGDVE